MSIYIPRCILLIIGLFLCRKICLLMGMSLRRPTPAGTSGLIKPHPRCTCSMHKVSKFLDLQYLQIRFRKFPYIVILFNKSFPDILTHMLCLSQLLQYSPCFYVKDSSLNCFQYPLLVSCDRGYEICF